MRGIKNKLLRRRSGSLAASEPASGISASSSTSSSSSSPSPITGASMSTESDAEEFNVASKTKPISITRRFPKADSVVQSPTAGSITIVKSPHIRTISATPGARSPASPFKFFSKHKIVTYRPKPYNLVRPPKASDPKGSSSSSSSSSSSKTLGNSSGAGGTGRPSNLTDYTKLFPPDKITQKMPFSSNTSFTSVDAHSWKQPPKSDTFTKISKRVKRSLSLSLHIKIIFATLTFFANIYFILFF